MPKVGMEPIRKAAIINATLECICEAGIESVTLEKVAAKAGCSKGVVAYYFKTKKQLLMGGMKAFLSYYKKKIGHEIRPGMSADEMLEVVVRISLPPMLDRGEGEAINVSELSEPEELNVPPMQKAILFMQFFSRAMTDGDYQVIIREVYELDIAGMGEIMKYGIQSGLYRNVDADEKAYGLMSLIIGLSFFRVIGFFRQDGDNREICQQYLQDALKR
jgi:TetR/AcrR family transcriptional repressor of bet genes